MIDHTQSPNTLRRLAERAAMHPRIEQAVIGAIRGVLPSVLEQLIAEEAEAQGGHVVRLYGRRAPSEERQQRDQLLESLLSAGMSPVLAALQVGCSRRHAYTVQARQRSVQK